MTGSVSLPIEVNVIKKQEFYHHHYTWDYYCFNTNAIVFHCNSVWYRLLITKQLMVRQFLIYPWIWCASTGGICLNEWKVLKLRRSMELIKTMVLWHCLLKQLNRSEKNFFLDFYLIKQSNCFMTFTYNLISYYS